ncbi:uncharacterized protein G2W53_007584 [Senna tora]|uniref:Uncharacterized protein n=1 Tax=Senna tora TaxID=362788 RepID=A0A835CHE1_9FABA|nr:uncharacterized protein G2W53_007584 [Senna tora]
MWKRKITAGDGDLVVVVADGREALSSSFGSNILSPFDVGDSGDRRGASMTIACR